MSRALLAFFCLTSLVPAAEPPVQRSGKYQVLLRLPDAGLYAGEEQQIEFRVTDTSRPDAIQGPAPVIRAKLTGTVDMPAMAGMPKVVEIAHPEGVAGEYGMHPTFPHGGEYRLRIHVEPPADSAFTLEFPLPVADASDSRKPGLKAYKLELTASPKNPKAGQPVELTMRILRQGAQAGQVVQYDKVHEADMHLIVVRNDLGIFQHEHPQLDANGVFHHKMTLPEGGEYRLFADVAPRGAGSQVLPATLKVGGRSNKFSVSTAARSAKTTIEATTVELNGSQFPARKTITIKAQLTDSATGPAKDLVPYYGAMGHLILIHQDAATYVHSHPDERDPALFANGTIPFLARFPKPGIYRGWAQFQRNKTVITAPFIVEAQ